MLGLVADDDSCVLRTTVAILGHVGYEVLAVDNGTDAVEVLLTNMRVKFAIIDVNMPGNSGLEVMRIVRLSRPDLPIIIMSGDLTAELDATAAGASFLKKPFGAIEVSTILLAALARRPAGGTC